MKLEHPLQWPHGWPRHSDSQRRRDRFSSGGEQITVSAATRRVLHELKHLGVTRNVIISTNLRTADDWQQPDDPGVAVYFGDRCMAVDCYESVAGNLAAVAATLQAMRAIERHGGAEVRSRAFTGFAALPAPEQPWQVLGLATSTPSGEEIEDAYRRLAMKHHPDRGGDPQAMARINAARSKLLEKLS